MGVTKLHTHEENSSSPHVLDFDTHEENSTLPHVCFVHTHEENSTWHALGRAQASCMNVRDFHTHKEN